MTGYERRGCVLRRCEARGTSADDTDSIDLSYSVLLTYGAHPVHDSVVMGYQGVEDGIVPKKEGRLYAELMTKCGSPFINTSSQLRSIIPPSFTTIMAYDFNGKVCLITGAGSGIGRAAAIKMANLGAEVILTDVNENGLTETAHACNTDSMDILDVRSSKACEAVIDAAVSRHEGLDFVFNCAGVNPTAYPLTETTDEYWQLLMDTNLKGTYNITKHAIPHLKPGASIVNVSSVMGVSASANYAIYCATKWGVVGFTKAMALELGPRQIRVNAVAPGYINTPTNAAVVEGPESIKESEAKIAMGRMGEPEDIADVVAFLFRLV